MCLLLDNSHSGVRYTQSNRGPVLFPCGGHQALYSPVDNVHTWGGGEREREMKPELVFYLQYVYGSMEHV